MRRHAKASSSGSSKRQASRLGYVIRGAFATPCASRRAKGSGAPLSHRPRIGLGLLAAAVLAGAVFLGAVQALASAPTVTTGSATAITDVAATLHGSLDPTGVETTDCHFEWGTDTSYGNSASCAQGNAFTEPSEVSAELSGLSAATTYHYRLVVTNGEGESQGEDRSFATAGPPSVSRTFVSEVSARAATLNADLNPEGGATSYHFEYVDDAAFQASGFSGASEAPVPDGQLAAAFSPLTVSVPLTGLQPGTYYHYRLIASNFAGPLTGPERIFRTDPLPRLTQPGQFPGQGFLPDNRAWEMVSPPEKNGGGLRAGSPRTVVSPDGQRVSYAASAAFGDIQGTGALGDVQYVATRNSGGWTSRSITPASAPEWTQTIFGITRALPSENLSHAAVQAYDLPGASGDVPEGISNLYRVDADGANLTTLTSPFDPGTAKFFAFASTTPIGGDSDFDHIYFSSALPLLPGPALGTPNVYEWDEGTLSLAGVLPDGSLPPAGSREVVKPQKADLSASLNSVSTDGSKVLFSAAAPSGSNSQIYMRRDHTNSVWVSESEGSTPVSDPQGVTFGWATPDLHKVAFTTESQLNDEDPGGSGIALYVYTDSPDPEGENNLEFIYRGSPAVAGMGVDGASGYFVDTGSDYLFHWDESGAHAVIDADVHGGGPLLHDILNEGPHSAESRVRVSADGTRIVFSHRNTQLTEAEVGFEPGATFPYATLYVYDSDTDKLTCASCPPSGAATTGETWLWPQAPEDTGIYYIIEGARFLSADGRYAFFSSPDALVPEDVNGRYDAYEYDIDTGEPHLLSSGHSSRDSWFASASASGDDAFFITSEALSGNDVDNAKDMYDARVDGGLPEPLPAPPACEGDACQPAPNQLNDPTPASEAFAGQGNAKAKKHHRRHRARRHHAKRQHGHHKRANSNRRAAK